MKKTPKLNALVYGLALVRIVLCMFPQNEWLSAHPPIAWGIIRNVPFALLGAVIILLFAWKVKETRDRAFRWMALTIVLSFAFYIPVVLWAEKIPMIGMLMIPKTCAYMWTIWIGYEAMKKSDFIPFLEERSTRIRRSRGIKRLDILDHDDFRHRVTWDKGVDPLLQFL